MSLFGDVAHDLAAEGLKGIVQPFASFTKYSQPQYDTAHIFNPVLKTGAFQEVDKVINVANTIGHVAGKAYTTSVVTKLGADTLFKSTLAPPPPPPPTKPISTAPSPESENNKKILSIFLIAIIIIVSLIILAFIVKKLR